MLPGLCNIQSSDRGVEPKARLALPISGLVACLDR